MRASIRQYRFGSVPLVIPTAYSHGPLETYPRRRSQRIWTEWYECARRVEEPPAVAAQVNRWNGPAPPDAFGPKSQCTAGSCRPVSPTIFGRHPELSPGDVSFTANTGRSHFGHRLAIIESTVDGMRARLASFLPTNAMTSLTGAVELSRRPKVAFLFTGQGAQYAGMGQSALPDAPTFRRAIDRVADSCRQTGPSAARSVISGGRAMRAH